MLLNQHNGDDTPQNLLGSSVEHDVANIRVYIYGEVQAAMTTRNLETDQWRNREEWRLVSGRRRQML